MQFNVACEAEYSVLLTRTRVSMHTAASGLTSRSDVTLEEHLLVNFVLVAHCSAGCLGRSRASESSLLFAAVHSSFVTSPVVICAPATITLMLCCTATTFFFEFLRNWWRNQKLEMEQEMWAHADEPSSTTQPPFCKPWQCACN